MAVALISHQISKLFNRYFNTICNYICIIYIYIIKIIFRIFKKNGMIQKVLKRNDLTIFDLILYF